MWGTTLDELVRWKDGVRKDITPRNGLPCDGIFALVQDKRGSLWLYTQCGLIAIDKPELDAWWEHPDRSVKFRLFDTFDGVRPGLTSLTPQAARSPDGRLWFVNGRIMQMLDPNHLRENEMGNWNDSLGQIWPIQTPTLQWPPKVSFTKGGPQGIAYLMDRWRMGEEVQKVVRAAPKA